MISYRVIARLDIKGPNVVKGIGFEGLRVMGRPADLAERYGADADEVLFIDTVASLYGRNQLESVLEEATEKVFVPLTVGGGIGCVAEATRLMRHGADKIALNTGAIRNPELINELSTRFGPQAVVVSIQAKHGPGGWEAYTEGRNKTGRDAVEWAHEAVHRGAGEILLTSVDMDGTRRGPDRDLIEAVKLDVPVIYSGGTRRCDVGYVSDYTDGVAVGAALHYGDTTIAGLKDELRALGRIVR